MKFNTGRTFYISSMQVYKFGGASIKNAEAIKNVGSIIKKYGAVPLIIVVSAMGKTTRALEQLLESYGTSSFQTIFNEIRSYHLEIMCGLFSANHLVYNEVEAYFSELKQVDFVAKDAVLLHAQVVSYGELLSSVIIYNYIKAIRLESHWLYAPEVIKTERQYSEGNVVWEQTIRNINNRLSSILDNQMVITQGYIASCDEGLITLGKEGSDFTAAIFAASLKAEKVTIWKDVPGILNADPKEVDNPVQLFKLHYKEASEMTYYGASVIHPKTIKPLALHAIPLEVRSFDMPDAPSTIIHDFENTVLEPSIIFKKNQCLFSFKVLDYTFVDEENLATIFRVLHELNLPINMMQNSAISLSVCFTYDPQKVDRLLSLLADRFTMYYNTGLKLITIKNFSKKILNKQVSSSDDILLEQRTRNNYRALIREN